MARDTGRDQDDFGVGRGGRDGAPSGNRPKVKAAKESAGGTTYVDYKETETLRRLMTGNGRIVARRRTGLSSMEQRMAADAIKRARYMALLPYTSTAV